MLPESWFIVRIYSKSQGRDLFPIPWGVIVFGVSQSFCMARVFRVTANPNQFLGDALLQNFHQLAILEFSKAIQCKEVKS
jgi:hypothetical protein